MPMREPRPHRRGERFKARPEVGLFAVDWFAPAKVADSSEGQRVMFTVRVSKVGDVCA